LPKLVDVVKGRNDGIRDTTRGTGASEMTQKRPVEVFGGNQVRLEDEQHGSKTSTRRETRA
jgi:hypothetical protein